MSLHNDPPIEPPIEAFDLLKTGRDMDNVVPFLSPAKVNQMIDAALLTPQVKVKPKNHLPIWKFSGLAAVACMVLFMVFVAPPSAPIAPQENAVLSQNIGDEAAEFSELVMLETWERY